MTMSERVEVDSLAVEALEVVGEKIQHVLLADAPSFRTFDMAVF